MPTHGWFPVGQKRKLLELSERCVFAWAGQEIQAKAFFRELQASFNLDRGDPSELQSFVNDYGSRDLDDLALIGMFAREGTVYVVSIGASPMEGPSLGKSWIAGSGGEVLRHDLDITLAAVRRIAGTPRSDSDVWPFAMNLLATLMRKDMSSSDYDSALFGGAFEIAISNRDSCGVLNDYAVSFLDLTIDKNGGVCSGAMSILYQHLQNHTLNVERHALQHEHGLTFTSSSPETFHIPPVFVPTFNRSTAPLGIENTGRLHIVSLFESETNRFVGPATLLCGPSQDWIAKIVRRGDNVEVELSREGLLQIAQDITAKHARR